MCLNCHLDIINSCLDFADQSKRGDYKLFTIPTLLKQRDQCRHFLTFSLNAFIFTMNNASYCAI